MKRVVVFAQSVHATVVPKAGEKSVSLFSSTKSPAAFHSRNQEGLCLELFITDLDDG